MESLSKPFQSSVDDASILTDPPLLSSDDVYDGLREGLLGRLQDKEVSVRVQAVISLSKLSCSERIDDLRHGEQLLEETLMQTLGLDPSS